ncbi:hypothetical protein [Brunnivagina elsteri]|uniref:Uncharacterized protein n=1 Tax=Brunnivagina elsteri CCALA 953 TaxID=987040 RepID=A0A2A2TN43_9CYAN|nr:hypothetical protein [Calothrix elsteri]PAX59870.1 hypothetical protein CK510_04790 [Calothrix elsteri CCALA 953]
MTMTTKNILTWRLKPFDLRGQVMVKPWSWSWSGQNVVKSLKPLELRGQTIKTVKNGGQTSQLLQNPQLLLGTN